MACISHIKDLVSSCGDGDDAVVDAEHTFYLTEQGESAGSTVPWVVGGLVLDCKVNLLCSDWDTVALDVLVEHLETTSLWWPIPLSQDSLSLSLYLSIRCICVVLWFSLSLGPSMPPFVSCSQSFSLPLARLARSLSPTPRDPT